jgi:phospho-N-acetylmuramoyl-pentapeptide-transferase
LRWAARIGVIAVASHHEIVLGIIGGLVRGRGAVGDHSGVLLQAHRQACVQDGADPPSFEQLGWPETTVVIRFWIVSFVLALAASPR